MTGETHSYFPPVSPSQNHPRPYPVPRICKSRAPSSMPRIFGEQQCTPFPRTQHTGAAAPLRSRSAGVAVGRCRLARRRRCRCWCPNRGERLSDPCGADSGGTGRTFEGISPSLPWGACCSRHLPSNEFWVQGLAPRTAGTGDRASSGSRSSGCRSSLDAPTRVLGEGYTA